MRLNMATGALIRFAGGVGGGLPSAVFNCTAGDIAVDSSGALFFSDPCDSLVRRIDLATLATSVVAGTKGLAGYSGDGAGALSARLSSPRGLALDASGAVFVADTANNAVRRIDAKTGVITTIASQPRPAAKAAPTYRGAARGIALKSPSALAATPNADLYVADKALHAVLVVRAATAMMEVFAGTPAQAGASGDGAAATSARLNAPQGLVFSADGALLIADTANHAIRRVAASGGAITTVAGALGVPGASGEGVAATSALLRFPAAVTVHSDRIVICDTGNDAIRVVSAAGVISTLAAVPAPRSILVFYPDYLVITGSKIVKVSMIADPSTGQASVSTWISEASLAPGGGSACASSPQGLAIDPTNLDILLADAGTNSVRRIQPSGTIDLTKATVIGILSGSGQCGSASPIYDNGPRDSLPFTSLSAPAALIFGPRGEVYIADAGNGAVRIAPMYMSSMSGTTAICPAGFSCPKGRDPQPCYDAAQFCPQDSASPLPGEDSLADAPDAGLGGAYFACAPRARLRSSWRAYGEAPSPSRADPLSRPS